VGHGLAVLLGLRPENGIRLMLEHSRNVHELLRLTEADVIDAIDFSGLQQVKTTFVKRDFRKAESDIVWTAPLRTPRGGQAWRILVYVLLEHQSLPDWLMPLRVPEYELLIYRYQVRQWEQDPDRAHDRPRLMPVLPIVFYTGTRKWESVGRLVDLVEMGERFARFTVSMEPLFVNLREIAPEKLETDDGFFTWVLRLLQQRKARPREFRRLLVRVLRRLEAIPPEERARWLDLLSYIYALIYHEREDAEIVEFRETISESAHTEETRRELYKMGKTYAQVLEERGIEKGIEKGKLTSRRETLIRLLRGRFGELPHQLVETIEHTDDLQRLDTWLDRVLSAKRLEEMRIIASR
jgi:hypothetical protein